jgi:hypothetical protein
LGLTFDKALQKWKSKGNAAFVKKWRGMGKKLIWGGASKWEKHEERKGMIADERGGGWG